MTDPIVVACAADRAYVRPLAVTLVSLLAHLDAGRTLAVHIVDGDIPEPDKRLLERSLDNPRARVVWHAPPNRRQLLGVPLWGRLPISVYYKLFVPDLLADDIHTALWVDGDTLVRSDISLLWDRGTGGAPLAAVQDARVPLVSSQFGVAFFRELGLRPAAEYFNAGVMLMDLDRWRSDRVADRALEYLKKRPAAVWFLEQEGLNAVLADNWEELEPAWNWSVSLPLSRLRADDARAHVVHFTGNLKPWKYRGRHPYHVESLRMSRPDGLERMAAAARLARGRAALGTNRDGVRRILLPSERFGTRCWKALTRRVATTADVTSAS